MARKNDKAKITIIKKEEVIEGGHHGGAWKVAYADFVTAMMAFFLLMWLLNATTEAQRRGLADYFSPTLSSSRSTSGSGKPFGGTSPFEDGPAISNRGALATMNQNTPPVDVEDDDSDTQATRSIHNESGNAAKGEQGRDGKGGPQSQAARQEQAALAKAAADIRQIVSADPALAAVARQLSVDLTPEGLRVQLRDEERQPMFATGSAEPNEQAQALLHRLLPILVKLPEPVSISGYTDATPYAGAGRSNWDLSADRANATRRLLIEGGLPETRLRDVIGHADRDLLLPAQPLAAANRRIAVVLLRQAPPPANASPASPAGRQGQ
jgi:chemotaxis protein MotB